MEKSRLNTFSKGFNTYFRSIRNRIRRLKRSLYESRNNVSITRSCGNEKAACVPNEFLGNHPYGMDIRIKCDHCGQMVLMPRREFEKKMKKVDDFCCRRKQIKKECDKWSLTAGIVVVYQTLESQHYLMQLQKQGRSSELSVCDD